MRRLIAVLVFGLLGIFSFQFAPAAAQAPSPAPPPQTQEGILSEACKQAPTSPACPEANNQSGNLSENPTVDVIQTAANLISLIAGIAAVIVIIISGIMYATAGGAPAGQRAGDSPTKAKNAQATMINAAVGLVIIALAWAIVSFVIQKVIS